MQKICRNCKWFKTKTHEAYGPFGKCKNWKVDYYSSDNPSSDMDAPNLDTIDLDYHTNMTIGPEFGCIHFEAAQEDQGNDQPAETVDGD